MAAYLMATELLPGSSRCAIARERRARSKQRRMKKLELDPGRMPQCQEHLGGSDGARTRDLRRDRPAL